MDWLDDCRRGRFWLPKSDAMRIRICADVPSRSVVYEEFKNLLTFHNKNMGITSMGQVQPSYMLAIIANLDSNHHFFDNGYVKPAKVKTER